MMKKISFSFLLLVFFSVGAETINLDIAGVATIAGLKKKIARETNIPVDELHIIVDGIRIVNNRKRIADLNIQPGDTINVVREQPFLNELALARAAASAIGSASASGRALQQRKKAKKEKKSRGVHKKKRR